MIATQRENVPAPLFNPATLGVGLALCFALGYAGSSALENNSPLSMLAVLMLLQIAPFALGATVRKVNYLSFILLTHFVSYSVAKLNSVVNLQRSLENADTLGALRELIICTTLIILGYFLGRILTFRDEGTDTEFRPLSLSRGQLLFVGLYVLSFPFTLTVIPWSLFVIHYSAATAQMLVLITCVSPGNENLLKLLRALIPVGALFYFVNTGHLSMFGQYATFAFITTCIERKYKRLLYILVMTVIVSAAQTVKEDFRTYINGAGWYDSQTTKIATLAALLEDRYVNGEKPKEIEQYDPETGELIEIEPKEQEGAHGVLSGFDRLGDESLERVMAITPKIQPYWGGSTYETIPYMLIPRALWSDKPSRDFWNRFGRVYGFLGDDDMLTSVAVSFLAEAYINFGFGFMYLIAFAFGAFAALVERTSYLLLGCYCYLPYVTLLLPLTGYANDLGTILNSITILTVGFVVLRRPLLRLVQRDAYS